jgi:hypothetical protein
MRQERNILPEGEVRSGLLGSVAVCLALLRTVDAAQSDAFRMVIVQDFEGVAVEKETMGHTKAL